MTTLRPLTTLDTAAVQILVSGDDSWGSVKDNIERMLEKHKITFRFKRHGDTLDLSGQTVSTLVAVHRGIVRNAKSAAKHDRATVTYTYLGDAADYDLDALANEPTPAEDHDCIKKVRKGAALTGAKWARALELMGLDAEVVKEGRKLVGFRMTIPGLDEDTYKIEYGVLAPSGAPHWSEEREDPEGYKARATDYEDRKKAAREWMVNTACELLGVENPNARKGLPARARDYRTDLTIRTCPVCFRDIKASGHTHGLIADHGYTIDPGYRMGSCSGTGRLPWEKSCDPAVEEIPNLLAYSERVEARLLALESGEVTSLKIQGGYNWKKRTYDTITVTPEDGYKWKDALRSAIHGTRRKLEGLWSGHYGSIPWMRMAVRTWKPVPDDHVAIGAPNYPTVEADYEGKPEVLNS